MVRTIVLGTVLAATMAIARAAYPALIKAEIEEWRRVVRDAGVKVED